MGCVICLGTGDPLNAQRAQTSVAARLAGDATILFDASSGTMVLGRPRDAGIPIEESRRSATSS